MDKAPRFESSQRESRRCCVELIGYFGAWTGWLLL
ncbi:unnamed protein product [Brassica rapa subsp. trilocularis]